mgnify:CR=1 FL=1
MQEKSFKGFLTDCRNIVYIIIMICSSPNSFFDEESISKIFSPRISVLRRYILPMLAMLAIVRFLLIVVWPPFPVDRAVISTCFVSIRFIVLFFIVHFIFARFIASAEWYDPVNAGKKGVSRILNFFRHLFWRQDVDMSVAVHNADILVTLFMLIHFVVEVLNSVLPDFGLGSFLYLFLFYVAFRLADTSIGIPREHVVRSSLFFVATFLIMLVMLKLIMKKMLFPHIAL